MREVVLQLEESRIREVANAGMGRPDVMPFWFGESDEVTPQVVRDAAAQSLAAGETFYSHNLGLGELREALSAYMSRLHGSIGVQRLAVTSGGVNALMLAVQMLVDAGDHVVAVTPVWPNLTAQPVIMGARLTRLPLRARDGAWQLDLDALLAAITPATRLLIVNSPNNPTGWTLTRDEQSAILAQCRRTGTWILADEVYERLYYGAQPAAPAGPGADAAARQQCAPSFLDIATGQDRLVVAHSFSKSFLMTGWRLGWLVMPPDMTAHMGKLLEFNTSCAPVFVQRAGLAALAHEGEITPRVVAHLHQCRDTLAGLLGQLAPVRMAPAPGGMYAFFRLEGHDDDLAVAKALVAQAGLGLAPGSAFDPAAAGWLRWCYASRDPARLASGVQRLRGWLGL